MAKTKLAKLLLALMPFQNEKKKKDRNIGLMPNESLFHGHSNVLIFHNGTQGLNRRGRRGSHGDTCWDTKKKERGID